jgi:hypothetical protein
MRSTIELKLIDDALYTFSERNREDHTGIKYQDALRKHKIKLIYENVVSEDDRLALVMQQINMVYPADAISLFIESSKEVKQEMLYDSFKINNPDISIETFRELVPDDKIDDYLIMLGELEAQDATSDKDLCIIIGIDKKQLELLKKQHPHLIAFAKKNVKKK